MDLNLLFPTIIGKVNDKSFTNKILPIATQILSENDVSNLEYKSTFGNIKVTNYLSNIDFIKDKILDLCKEFVSKINSQIPDWDKVQLEIFVSKMVKNDQHHIHCHPNSILSGVAYLDMPYGSSSIEFYDSKDAREFNGLYPKTTKKNNQLEININHLNETSHQIPLSEGDILIWESWIKHSVSKNNSDNRTTLIFNLGPKY